MYTIAVPSLCLWDLEAGHIDHITGNKTEMFNKN